ncbi:MAG: ABC transporter permease, partial [Actinomyces sp.]
MFFARLVSRSFTRQPRRRGLIALTVALSTAISVAMLGVVLDVGDKLNAELTTYGSNIVVQPKTDAVVSGLYETGDEPDPTSFLKEDEVGNIKTIFWAYNIVDFAPSLTAHLNVSSGSVDGGSVRVRGTWFNKDLALSTGESVTAGVTTLRSWWKLDGAWPSDDADEAVVGSTLASTLGVHAGDTITLAGATGTKELT